MPTIINEDGFRVIIYMDDHLPPHVHVIKGNQEVKINLGSSTEAPYLLESWMTKKDAKKAMQIVMRNQNLLLKSWREIHG